MVDLSDNGERLIPNEFKGKTVIEHIHRYAWVLEVIRGKKVLDIACGEGYGSSLMSEVAKEVIGVDLSSNIIDHAKKKYKRSNLSFIVGNANIIQFEDETFDVIVSYETLEHLNEHEEMISELNRVLRNDGILIISTPEKKFYSQKNNYNNQHHIKELYLNEFKDLIGSQFKFLRIFYQKSLCTSLIFSELNNPSKVDYLSGSFNEIKKHEYFIEPEYIIILASKTNSVIEISNSIFLNDQFSEKKSEIHKNAGFRYKLINLIFAPWDYFKKVIR